MSAPLNTSVNAETGECSKLRMSGVTVGEIAVMSAMWFSVRMIDVMAYCLSLRRRARRKAIYQRVGANHAYMHIDDSAAEGSAQLSAYQEHLTELNCRYAPVRGHQR